MTRRWPQFGLPLLTKELIEQAARRRTYFVRLLYASLLFLLTYWQFQRILARSGQSNLAMLGKGTDMFDQVVNLQFLGIVLFLPALACGAITSEKERDSLTMLLVTRLGPTTILLEKLLGRLVPMFTFQLLSLPLLAFAYSLGGISTVELVSGISMLFASCVFVGSLAIMCSSWCGSTVSAFVGTYAIGLLSYPVLAFVSRLFLGLVGATGVLTRTTTAVLYQVTVPIELTTDDLGRLFVQLGALLIPSLLWLILARLFLVRRAQVSRRNLILTFFRRLDGFFYWLNDVTTGGVVLVRDDVALPDDHPITWRETQKKTLGTTRYLVRVLVSIETPLFLVLAAVAGMAYRTRLGVAAESLYVVWALAVMLIAVQATSLFTSERSHQTIDLLLASSMTGREIIQQKHRSLRRLIYVLVVPLVTIYLFECWFAMGTPGLEDGSAALFTVPLATVVATHHHFDYFLCSVLSAVVYLPLCSWIALFVGIRSRSQVRSLMLTLLVLFGWAFLPVLIAAGQTERLVAMLLERPPLALVASLCSPSIIILINELGGLGGMLEGGDLLWYAACNFAAYGLAGWMLRRYCLAHADRLLGRHVPGESHPAPMMTSTKKPT